MAGHWRHGAGGQCDACSTYHHLRRAVAWARPRRNCVRLKSTMTTTAAAVSTPAVASHPVRSALLLGALGVVFGDIGTSPIYAFRESLKAAGGPATEATVLGVLSLVFWAVVLIVALKYVVFVMRADNDGEGGTMALLSLALPVAGRLKP